VGQAGADPASGPPVGGREESVRLVACRACHAQYDASTVEEVVFDCRCGAPVRNEPAAAVDARIRRCSACGALLEDEAAACAWCRAAVVRDARALSLICPECYARNAEAARFCSGCGVAFQPEPLPHEREEPPGCPDCGQAMAVRGVGGVWVRECAKCNGLWVPGERLDTLVERAVEAARLREATGSASGAPRPRSVARAFAYRHCPVCKQRMHRKNFGRRSGVIVDWCGPHGTWLDRDELEQIASFVAAGGLRGAGTGDAAGLSEGGRMSLEQFRALVLGERMLEQERARRERRGALLEPATARGGSGVGAVLELLGKLLD
jgi:Zn-finger nucleic acid-binding protein